MLGDRRIGEDFVPAIAVRDLVLAKGQRVRNDRGQRIDAIGVHFLELLDPAEDIVELGHQPLDLLIAHGDASKLRNVAHLFGGN